MNDRQPYDESPEHRRRIRDAIDACRPAPAGENIDDLNQPEVEFLAAHLETHPEDRRRLEQVQQFDRHLRDQLAQVPVPTGFAGRLLKKLDQAATLDKARSGHDALEEAVADDGMGHGALRPSTREKQPLGRKLWIGIAIAATIAIVIPLTNWLRPTPTLLKSDLYHAALAWFDQHQGLPPVVIDQAKMKKLYSVFPLSDRVVGARGGAPLSNFLDRDGVVYSLTSPKGLQAKLLVVKAGSALLDSDIPIGRPSEVPYGTQGLSLLVWREDDLLYVLIVPNSPTIHEPYKQFLESAMPIAWLRDTIARLAIV